MSGAALHTTLVQLGAAVIFSVGLLGLRGGSDFVSDLGLDLVSWLWILFHGGFMGRGFSFMVVLWVAGFVSQILCSWVLLHGGFKHPPESVCRRGRCGCIHFTVIVGPSPSYTTM
ncbi:hypothetical protein A2U01_0042205, partial [Trifolium medium]|nr:hypothetical protein [Trifolium medium]